MVIFDHFLPFFGPKTPSSKCQSNKGGVKATNAILRGVSKQPMLFLFSAFFMYFVAEGGAFRTRVGRLREAVGGRREVAPA
jgi:hypothetical protein